MFGISVVSRSKGKKMSEIYFNTLLVSEVRKRWDDIYHYVKQALPPTAMEHEDVMQKNDLLLSVVGGALTCWIITEAESEKVSAKGRMVGVMLTCICTDPGGAVGLTIYSLTGVENLPFSTWEIGLATIRKYAESKGCKKIFAYTYSEKVAKLAERLGGKADWRVIELEV